MLESTPLVARKRTAVLVDDDPDVHKLVRRTLAELDVECVSFYTGESALELFATDAPTPDIMAVDVLLPRMSGIAVCEALRRRPRTSSVPLILMTARQDLDDEAAAVALDAVFLPKPFRLRELLALARDLLARPRQEVTRRTGVMIVDDDAGVREALRGVVEDEGCEAICARDGFEALSILGSGPIPSLMLLDIMMPGLDGISLATRLRAATPFSSLPLVMLSASENVAAHARTVGAVAHFRKPFQLDDLLAVIRSYSS